jgi:hypothetical protein
MMMLDQQYHEELRALRNLEKAVRVCLVSARLITEQQKLDIVAAALREVVQARKTTIKKSKFTPFR